MQITGGKWTDYETFSKEIGSLESRPSGHKLYTHTNIPVGHLHFYQLGIVSSLWDPYCPFPYYLQYLCLNMAYHLIYFKSGFFHLVTLFLLAIGLDFELHPHGSQSSIYEMVSAEEDSIPSSKHCLPIFPEIILYSFTPWNFPKTNVLT